MQPKEYLAKYGADRVRTLSTVWLGSTMGCAECHDHKFDPFTSKDFYSMKAFFADIRETGLISDRGANAWGAKLMLPTAEQNRAAREFEEANRCDPSATEGAIRAPHRPAMGMGRSHSAAYKSGELAWRYQRPLSATAINGAKLTIYNDEPVDSNFYLKGSLHSERKRGDGLVVASGANPDNETYTVTFKPGEGSWTALGIDVFQDESLPGNRFARGADRFVLTEVEAELSGNGCTGAETFVRAGDFPRIRRDAGESAHGRDRRRSEDRLGRRVSASRTIRFSRCGSPPKYRHTADSVITVRLHHDSDLRRATIGRFRLALSPSEHSWPEDGDSAKKFAAAEASKSDSATLNTAAERGLPPRRSQRSKSTRTIAAQTKRKRCSIISSGPRRSCSRLTVRLAKLQAERDLLDSSIPSVMLTEATKPAHHAHSAARQLDG